jgi:hypothetical protein
VLDYVQNKIIIKSEKRVAILNLRAKLLDAEEQRLAGAKTYTASEVRDYIRGLHNATYNVDVLTIARADIADENL